MLSATTAFKDEMSRAGIQPVYIVEIHLSDSDVRYFSTTYVDIAGLAGPVYPSVSDVVGVASSIDIETRAVSIGEFHVHFVDDGVVRDLVKDNFLYGKKIVIKLGSTGLNDYSDFLNVVVGVTRDIVPAEGEISLECADMLDMLRGKTVGPRYWLNGHPLEIMLDILKASGMGSSNYDATTMNWESDLSRSHYLVSRYDARRYQFDEAFVSNGVNDSGESAQDLIQELCELIHGSFAPDENGIFKFKLYLSSNAVVRDFSESDVSGVEQVSAASPLYNSVSFNVTSQSRPAGETDQYQLTQWGPTSSKDVVIGFTQQDATSRSNYNFLGNDSGENDLELTTSWLMAPSGIHFGLKTDGGVLKLDTMISRPGIGGNEQRVSVFYDADGVTLKDAPYNGFCGSKFDLGTIEPASTRVGDQARYPHTFPVKTNRGLSASRPAYLLFEGLAIKFQNLGTVKTIPTIGDTDIEIESANIPNTTLNMIVVFGSDKGPNSGGYAVTGWNGTTNTISISTGILTALPVGTVVYEICGPTVPGTTWEQWQTEIVKCTDSYSWGNVSTSTQVHYHRELFRFPGNDGCLGPWDRRTQRLPKSRDLAITAIGDNPTGVIDGEDYTWPYSTLYNSRYPTRVAYLFEGSGGPIGTNEFGDPGIGTAASGRGQFNTDIPYAWRFGDPGFGAEQREDDEGQLAMIEEGPQSLYHAQAWDITILVDTVNRMLQRFKNGCPRLKIKTTLAHSDLQLGDFVTITTDIYSAYGRDGADTDVVFEIVSKTVDALSDDPGCAFELAWVRDDQVVYPSSVYDYNGYSAQAGIKAYVDRQVYNRDSSDNIQPVVDSRGIMVVR